MAAREKNEERAVLDLPLAHLEQWLKESQRSIMDPECENGQCGPEAIALSMRRLGWHISAKDIRRTVARAAIHDDAIRNKTVRFAEANATVKDLICASLGAGSRQRGNASGPDDIPAEYTPLDKTRFVKTRSL